MSRLFLVAPPALEETAMLACATAAAQAGDCASILVPEIIQMNAVAALQSSGLAVIIKDCEPRLVHHLKADGMQVSRSEPVRSLRAALKSESLGMFAATSRHIAMEAAEHGADYIAFAQNSQAAGEPLIGWWQEIFEVPTVAYDPVSLGDLATLLPQRPDFIRPSDAMWESPAQAKEIVSALQAKLK